MSREDIDRRLYEFRLLKFGHEGAFHTVRDVMTEAILENGNTYYVDNGRYQCNGRAYRSLTDLYALCRNYIPSIDLSNILKELLENRRFSGWYCWDVERFVTGIGYRSVPMIERLPPGNDTEFGVTFEELLELYGLEYPKIK